MHKLFQSNIYYFYIDSNYNCLQYKSYYFYNF